MVLIVTACPAGLRGDLTKWLLEISPGVFVGRVSARIRETLWDRTTQLVKQGRALMVFSSNCEQGLEFKTHQHDWVPTDFDGITLLMRPTSQTRGLAPKTGWSKARAQRKRHYG